MHKKYINETVGVTSKHKPAVIRKNISANHMQKFSNLRNTSKNKSSNTWTLKVLW